MVRLNGNSKIILKKAGSLLLAVVLAGLLPLQPAAADSAASSGVDCSILDPAVYLNDSSISFDTAPVIVNGRTLVPVRPIMEGLGLTVSWEDKSQTVTGSGQDHTIIMKIGQDYFTDNGQAVSLDSPAIIYNNRTCIPVRALAEVLGCQVVWNNSYRYVGILYDGFDESLQEAVAVPERNAQAEAEAEKRAAAAAAAAAKEYTRSDTAAGNITANSCPYCIVVNTANCTTRVYGKDSSGKYTVLQRNMVCSTGRSGHETPKGNFSIYAHVDNGGYHLMVDGTYGRWCMRFKSGGYMFHTVCYAHAGDASPIASEVSALGTNVSRGCVRLSVSDAQWLYGIIADGTKVAVI